MSLSSQTLFLVTIARTKEEILDAIYPHGPIISPAGRHIMASMIIKSLSKEIKDQVIAKELNAAGKSLFDTGMLNMHYDNDLPPWPKRWHPNWLLYLIQFSPFYPHPEPWALIDGPGPQPWALSYGEEMLNPQPLPPKSRAYYGALLTLLADAVSIPNVADTLRSIGRSLTEAHKQDPETIAA